MAKEKEDKEEKLPANVERAVPEVLIDDEREFTTIELEVDLIYRLKYLKTLPEKKGFCFTWDDNISIVKHYDTIERALNMVENPVGQTFEIIHLGAGKFKISKL